MHSVRNEQKSVKVDKVDFVQKMLEAKISSTINDADFDLLVALYEKAIEREVSNNKYSSTMKITTNQKELLNITV